MMSSRPRIESPKPTNINKDKSIKSRGCQGRCCLLGGTEQGVTGKSMQRGGAPEGWGREGRQRGKAGGGEAPPPVLGGPAEDTCAPAPADAPAPAAWRKGRGRLTATQARLPAPPDGLPAHSGHSPCLHSRGRAGTLPRSGACPPLHRCLLGAAGVPPHVPFALLFGVAVFPPSFSWLILSGAGGSIRRKSWLHRPPKFP